MHLIRAGIPWLLLFGLTSAWAQDNVNQITMKPPEADISPEGGKRYTGALSLSLSGRRFDDEIVNSRFTRAMLNIEVDAVFMPWLTGRFSAIQNFTSGAASNLYLVTEGAAGSNSAFVDEVYLTVLPTTDDALSTKLSAGIVSLGANPILSAMFSQSWMGAKTEIKNSGKDGFIALSAGQGTPSSGGTSNRVIDENTLPIYTTGALNGKIGLGDTGWSVGAAASHYVFTDLASQAAGDSSKLGATTMGNGRAGYLFVYEFRGMEYAALVEKKFDSGDKISLRGSTMRNELAPTGNNVANLGRIEYDRSLSAAWKLKAGLTAFAIQSDALPATYAISSYGFTNRKGSYTSLKFENKKEKYSLFAGYTVADVLQKDVSIAPAAQYQADRLIYSLGAEVNHDIF